MKSVLHVGCGYLDITRMPSGFQDGSWREVRFDIDPNVKPDVVGTITDLSAVESESVDAVYSSHNIEHVETHEVDRVLQEFRRVLTPEGFAVVTCPDLQALAARIATGKLTDPLYQSTAGPITALDVLFGHGREIAEGRSYMAHRTGFSGQTLADAIRRAGFENGIVKRREPALDLWAICSRSPRSREELERLMFAYGGRDLPTPPPAPQTLQ